MVQHNGKSLGWESNEQAELDATGSEKPGTDLAYQSSKMPTRGAYHVRVAPFDCLLGKVALSQLLQAPTQLLLLSEQPRLIRLEQYDKGIYT